MARPRQISDELILKAARALFLERGPNTSTAAIATKLNISEATLFKRFPTKGALLWAALAPPPVPPWSEELRRGPSEGPVKPQLHMHLKRILAFFRETVPCMMALRSSGLQTEDILDKYDVPPPVVGRAAMTHWLQQAHEAGKISVSSAEDTAMLLVGALYARTSFAHITRTEWSEADDEEYVARVLDTLWEGIGPRPGDNA